MDTGRGPTLEGRLYGEIAAWVTVCAIVVASAAMCVALVDRTGTVDYRAMLDELLAGRSEAQIWRSATSVHRVPSELYWFSKGRLDADSVMMAAIVCGCFGSVLGVLAMLASMFRSRRALSYKGGLYTVLTLAVATILVLAATGVVALRP